MDMHPIIQPFLGFLVLGTSLLGILTFVFWIWMLIDAIQNPRLEGSKRVVWVLVVIFLPCVGSLIYFFVGRQR
jgi:Phospholipase_D-nuclease N-terminal